MSQQITIDSECAQRGVSKRVAKAVVALIVAGGLLTACGSYGDGGNGGQGSELQQAAVKSGTGEIRRDLEPLTDRFPQLSAATSATWMSGKLGDERVPGAGLYWIDALIELEPAEYQALEQIVAGGEPVDLQTLPESSGLSPKTLSMVPPARLSTSAQLDAEFSHDQFESTAYLVHDGKTLILMSVFE